MLFSEGSCVDLWFHTQLLILITVSTALSVLARAERLNVHHYSTNYAVTQRVALLETDVHGKVYCLWTLIRSLLQHSLLYGACAIDVP